MPDLYLEYGQVGVGGQNLQAGRNAGNAGRISDLSQRIGHRIVRRTSYGETGEIAVFDVRGCQNPVRVAAIVIEAAEINSGADGAAGVDPSHITPARIIARRGGVAAAISGDDDDGLPHRTKTNPNPKAKKAENFAPPPAVL